MPSIRRQIERGRRDGKRGKAGSRPTPVELRPGTQLVREWHGRTHHVLMLEDGLMFEDRRYASLSQIAREITGAHWSGPRFFGLTSRRAGGQDG